jgi:hypothetical protein
MPQHEMIDPRFSQNGEGIGRNCEELIDDQLRILFATVLWIFWAL